MGDASINAGEKLIEGTVTAATLNVNDIFAKLTADGTMQALADVYGLTLAE